MREKIHGKKSTKYFDPFWSRNVVGAQQSFTQCGLTLVRRRTEQCLKNGSKVIS